jgi:hypothetical protein
MGKIKTIIGGEDKLNESCFYFCKYDFVYSTFGSCNATNEGNMIQLYYPEDKGESIVYNNLKYTPRQISIYYPSYFNYIDENNSEGKKADAEISIYHTTASSGGYLIVNIPIYINTNTGTVASSLVTEIIENVSRNAPNKSQQTTINFTSNFSLKSIIPRKPFYNFIDNSSNYVIFGKENSISITDSTYNNMLSQILHPYNASAMQDIDRGPFVYYNANGPNAKPEDNEIYISCNPTGNSEETKTIVYNKKGNKRRHNYGFNDDDEPPNDNGANEETSNDSTNNSSAINFFKSTPGIIVIVFSIIIFIVIMYIGFLKFLKPLHKVPYRNTIKYMSTNSLMNVFNPDKGNIEKSLRYLDD